MSIRTISATIEATPPISVYFSQYSNSSVLILTQVNKLGIFILAENENPDAQLSEKVYSTEIKFGDRCDEWSLALARGIVERLNIGTMMIIASIINRDSGTYNLILNRIELLCNH
jgi:Proteasome assembly chaperone 3